MPRTRKLQAVSIPGMLRELAAGSFDPDDYKHSGSAGYGCRCQVCNVIHAPRRVCGYCRGQVKMLRASNGPRVFRDPEIPVDEGDDA